MLITIKHKQARLAKVAEKEAATNKKKGKPARVLRTPPARRQTSAVRDGNENDVILAALAQDLDALKGLTAIEDKLALKKELLPKWKEVVDRYRESGAQHPFEPLVRLVIWLIDLGQIDQALDYATFAIAQKQFMPDGFKRDLPTYVTEEIQKWAEDQYKAGASAEPFFSQVIERVESGAWPVPQIIVISKLYRLAGMFAEREGDLEKAEAAYKKCMEANPEKHGVKTRFTAVQAKLGKTS